MRHSPGHPYDTPRACRQDAVFRLRACTNLHAREWDATPQRALTHRFSRVVAVRVAGVHGATGRAPCCSWHAAGARGATDIAARLSPAVRRAQAEARRGAVVAPVRWVAGKARRGGSQDSLRHVCLLDAGRRGRCARLAAEDSEQKEKQQSYHITDRRDTVACARTGTSASAVKHGADKARCAGRPPR